MAKGGGAWKVAYADFVTAMMAFFLVMWICAQDQKTKKAVADYFSNPSAIVTGESMTPNVSGAMFDGASPGKVPAQEKVARGKGRSTYSSKGKGSRVTNLVNTWLHSDEKVAAYWREQAHRQRTSARRAAGVHAKEELIERAASRRLADQMKQALTKDIPASARGLHKDLLTEITGDINWNELAEDFLAY